MMFPFNRIFQKVILHKIAKKQKLMLETAAQFGLNDDRTVQCSQELDKLINIYQENTFIKRSVEQN